MLRLDLILKEFSVTTSTALLGIMPDGSYELLPLNSDSSPDNSLVHILVSLKPGVASSSELGGSEALSTRVGVWIITQSLPKKMPVGDGLLTAAILEDVFRRQTLATEQCSVICEESYTEDRGTDPDTGRYLIQTTIPWHVVYEGQHQGIRRT